MKQMLMRKSERVNTPFSGLWFCTPPPIWNLVSFYWRVSAAKIFFMSCQIKYRCRAPLKILQFYSSISYARRVVACVALPSIHKDIKLKDPQIRSVTFIVDMGLCMTHNDILITIVGTASSTAAPIPPAWRRCQWIFAKIYNARRRPLLGPYTCCGHCETSRSFVVGDQRLLPAHKQSY